jgi:hypothetical protein
MKKIMIVCLSFWVVFSSIADAKCKRADVAGTWNMYFGVLGSATRCTVRSPRSGPTVANGSYCYLPGVINYIPLTGSLILSSNCHVTGLLNIYTTQFSVDAWISKDKETISGMSWDTTNNLSLGGVFSGVKM